MCELEVKLKFLRDLKLTRFEVKTVTNNAIIHQHLAKSNCTYIQSSQKHSEWSGKTQYDQLLWTCVHVFCLNKKYLSKQREAEVISAVLTHTMQLPRFLCLSVLCFSKKIVIYQKIWLEIEKKNTGFCRRQRALIVVVFS